MKEDVVKSYLKYTDYVSSLCGVESHVFSVQDKQFCSNGVAVAVDVDVVAQSFCGKLCPFASSGECVCENVHLYGCFQSERWSGKYIYYCLAGLIFVANAILDRDEHLCGGIITGPIVMSVQSDFNDSSEVEAVYESDEKISHEMLKTLPCFSTKKVRYLSEMINGLCGYGHFCRNEQEHEQIQKQQHNTMYYISQLYGQTETAYPIQYEKQLEGLIAAGDKQGSQELLNRLLGHIYFCSNGSFETVRDRIAELVVILSRATIDAGGDMSRVFWLNKSYLAEIKKLDDMEKINQLLSDILHRFISCVFDFENVKHADTIFKAIEYIKENYCNKISLEEVADKVHLSRSYLSRIFKEELSCTFTGYINKLRIEKSKSLLLNDTVSLTDIAMLTGFDDQSYFTKVFKKTVGASPGRFRELRGRTKENGEIHK